MTKGFSEGFDLGYRGPPNVKLTAKNLKFTIGSKCELWNKVMKEVQAKRYAGPFTQIPFEHYIQSPIGLVPKDGGKKTRLIFHLSYPKDGTTSVNYNTPKELCSVNYPDFDEAIKLCIKCGIGCKIGKSDLTSAFRHLCMAPKWWKYLVMKAQSPFDGKTYFFVDKCMPFGSSISCAHFQAFSDALSHIVGFFTGKENINYLDDFLFAALLTALCNGQIQTFLEICSVINFPVSLEKTFWGTTCLTFLGLLINTKLQLVLVPIEKVNRATNTIQILLKRPSKKLKLKELQKLCGFLNFLCKCIIPGRAFTRRLYSYGNKCSKPDHHIYMNKEFKSDLESWLVFLRHQSVFSRPFFQFDKEHNSEQLDWYTDASRNPELGMGGVHEREYFITQWDEKFITKNKPSINYLELFALTCAVYLWLPQHTSQSIIIFCDNESVVHMINTTSSKCKNCMVLIRLIVLQGLIHNTTIQARHVSGKLNKFADYLSRLKYKQFWELAKQQGRKFSNPPREIPHEIWPIDKIWLPTDQE